MLGVVLFRHPGGVLRVISHLRAMAEGVVLALEFKNLSLDQFRVRILLLQYLDVIAELSDLPPKIIDLSGLCIDFSVLSVSLSN